MVALSPLFCSAQTDAEHRRLTNLPHVYINTFTGRAVSSKTTEVYARMWYVDETDAVTFYDSLLIRGRGNSTWNMDKKPYRIKFAQKEKFLGKGYANTKKWTLLANHGDKALFRNALASIIGKRCGQKFVPAAKFIDLTLNGNYVGNYQISDQIDVRPHRVNIIEQDYPLTAQSNITGGYLLEIDGFRDYKDGTSGWQTSTKQVPICIHYPDEEDIVGSQFNYIRSYVNRFENRLFASYYKEPERGYRALVDSTSLASWCLASEITANPDCYWSLYFYKEQDDDHLYWGPLWDFDIAFDNDNRLEERNHDPYRELMRTAAFADNNTHEWARRIWTDPWFTQLIYREYVRLYQGGLEAYLQQQIDSLATLLHESQELNYERWRIDRRTLREVVLHSTYDEYVDDLRRFISIRVPALVTAIAATLPTDVNPDDIVGPTPVNPDFTTDEQAYYTIANARTGTLFDVNAEMETICANTAVVESQSQQWQVLPLDAGYYHIINRMTGLALTDVNEGEPGPTDNLYNTPLALTPPDPHERRQMWQLVRQAGDRYNLVNCYTLHTANLEGGSSNDGTNVVSHETSDKNATSMNRQWVFTAVDHKDTDAMPQLDDVSYALAYDPTGKRLHFGTDDLGSLHFNVDVFDSQGRRVLRFKASEGISVADLPRGIYVVAWTHNGRRRAVKFAR